MGWIWSYWCHSNWHLNASSPGKIEGRLQTITLSVVLTIKLVNFDTSFIRVFFLGWDWWILIGVGLMNIDELFKNNVDTRRSGYECRGRGWGVGGVGWYLSIIKWGFLIFYENYHQMFIGRIWQLNIKYVLFRRSSAKWCGIDTSCSAFYLPQINTADVYTTPTRSITDMGSFTGPAKPHSSILVLQLSKRRLL